MRGDTLIGNDRQTLVQCESTERVTIHQCRLVGQKNVPLGTVIGNARRIILTENHFIAPSVPTDGPRRILADIPELAALELPFLFTITDHEEFTQRARQIAQALTSRSRDEREGISNKIYERTKALKESREVQLIRALAGVLVTDRTEEILILLSALRNMSAALVLRDGEANTTLHANVITGLTSLYGDPSTDEISYNENALSNLTTRILRRDLEPITADGSFQANGNRLTRLVVGAEMIKWIQAIQAIQTGGTTGPPLPTPVPTLNMRIYRSCLLTDNVIDVGTNYFMAERISLTSTQFRTGNERSGVSIGLAATFISNDHYRSTSEFAFINACPIRIETPDLNLMEIDHV
jgi:hypothetical protein